MEFVLVYILGVIMGVIVAYTIVRSNSVGYLRIDASDPTEDPYLFLELTKNLDHIYHKRCITLRVSTKSYLSQK